jgi:fumarate hydratase class II
MTATRTESDSFGPLDVPADKYWGAQTQRSILNFPIGWEKQPIAIVRALGVIKKACAEANKAAGKLDARLADATWGNPRTTPFPPPCISPPPQPATRC